jgi:manganese/zinc/iron transport system ATP- binding protein
MFSYSRRVHQDIVPGTPALEVRDLTLTYPGTRRLALKGVSLCVPVGAQVALVGHNGAGKSTLLKAVAGLLPIRSGSITIYGNPPGACHHRVAYLPQRGEIDWRFPITLRKLVLTGRYVHLGWFKRPSKKDWHIADAVIDRLGLSELRERQISQLSGGQQQRALLARALAQEAELLLLDEPLNAVDAETRQMMIELLATLRHEQKAVVTATHDLGRLESDFDGALYLADGRESAPPVGAFTGLKVGELA